MKAGLDAGGAAETTAGGGSLGKSCGTSGSAEPPARVKRKNIPATPMITAKTTSRRLSRELRLLINSETPRSP